MPKALISGGGIGGLTAALCFHHFGWDADVYEQSPSLGEIGAGIQVSPNGMKIFRALGLDSEMITRGFRPEALEMRLGQSGHQVFRIPVSQTSVERWGAPYIHIHRADLIDVLETAVNERLPGKVHLNAQATGYLAKDSNPALQFADGTSVSGDVVIGADGIHSKLRAQMLGSDTPTYTGNVAWRAVVPIERLGEYAPPPTACVWTGKERHAVTYRLRGGQLANFVGIVERDDWQSESWTEKASRESALADFENWHPTITNIIDKADAHFRWALFDRKPLSQWHDGHIALLGDACHPTLPFLAQGAGMAIEDAYVIAARCNENKDEIPQGLSDYFEQRIARTSRVQKGSRGRMKTFHKRNLIESLATYGPMWFAGKILPGFVHSSQDWLYSHDVTQS